MQNSQISQMTNDRVIDFGHIVTLRHYQQLAAEAAATNPPRSNIALPAVAGIAQRHEVAAC